MIALDSKRAILSVHRLIFRVMEHIGVEKTLLSVVDICFCFVLERAFFICLARKHLLEGITGTVYWHYFPHERFGYASRRRKIFTLLPDCDPSLGFSCSRFDRFEDTWV